MTERFNNATNVLHHSIPKGRRALGGFLGSRKVWRRCKLAGKGCLEGWPPNDLLGGEQLHDLTFVFCQGEMRQMNDCESANICGDLQKEKSRK
jgi:hypothetical protein